MSCIALGEPGRLVLQPDGVHSVQPGPVDLDPRIFPARLRGPEQAADQAIGSRPGRLQVEVRVAPVDRDLGDHVLHLVDLDRPLPQDAPDLLHQPVEDGLIAHLVAEGMEQVPDQLRRVALRAVFGLARWREQRGRFIASTRDRNRWASAGDSRVRVLAETRKLSPPGRWLPRTGLTQPGVGDSGAVTPVTADAVVMVKGLLGAVGSI